VEKLIMEFLGKVIFHYLELPQRCMFYVSDESQRRLRRKCMGGHEESFPEPELTYSHHR
jgi:hypothetical protein